jgi:hypothetical protein
MPCKYKDHPFPPCQFEPHPRDKNVYFCPHCKEWYDVRDIGYQFPKWLLFAIALVIAILVFQHPQAFQPTINNGKTHTQG